MKAINPNLKIGITLSLHDIQALDGGEDYAKHLWEEEFTHYIPYIKDDDFLGLQNYTRSVVGVDGVETLENVKVTQMGYENYPEALENVIRRVVSELDIPILITENGIGISDDNERCEFIEKVSKGLKKCLNDNMPILGYLHWSLLDNFEWQKGYSKTFGLISVNRDTQERSPKRSLKILGSI